MTRTIEVREFESVELRLSADEITALRNSKIVEVSPSWADGSYQVRASHFVGFVNLQGAVTLRITPKLPTHRIFDLLTFPANFTKWDESLVQLSDDAPLDVAMVMAFVNATENALRQGVRSSYFTTEEDLKVLRGRMDCSKQIMRYGLPIPISVTHDQFGIDIAENQLIKGAALELQRLPRLPEVLRLRLRRIASVLAEATAAKHHESKKLVQFTRLNDHYRSAVALARMALEGLSFDVEVGHRDLTGFIVDMNKLFENFLEIALSEAIRSQGAGAIVPKKISSLDDKGHIRIIPDMTFVAGRLPRAVVDAKYKSLEDGMPNQTDIYQVVSYAVSLGVERAYLVYATPPSETPRLQVSSINLQITITGLDLSVPLPELKLQIEMLARDIADADLQLLAG